jgi:hypothetical protein
MPDRFSNAAEFLDRANSDNRIDLIWEFAQLANQYFNTARGAGASALRSEALLLEFDSLDYAAIEQSTPDLALSLRESRRIVPTAIAEANDLSLAAQAEFDHLTDLVAPYMLSPDNPFNLTSETST